MELRPRFGEKIIKRLKVFQAFGEPRNTCQSTEDVGFVNRTVAE